MRIWLGRVLVVGLEQGSGPSPQAWLPTLAHGGRHAGRITSQCARKGNIKKRIRKDKLYIFTFFKLGYVACMLNQSSFSASLISVWLMALPYCSHSLRSASLVSAHSGAWPPSPGGAGWSLMSRHRGPRGQTVVLVMRWFQTLTALWTLWTSSIHQASLSKTDMCKDVTDKEL